MDHVVYLDAKAGEFAKIMQGDKTMIIRGAAGRKLPYGRVFENDMLYLIENDGSGLVKAKARVSQVIQSEKMSKEESIKMIETFQDQLDLTSTQFKRWAGKRYLVFVEIQDATYLEPFQINKSDYGNMDDWLPVEKISRVQVSGIGNPQ